MAEENGSNQITPSMMRALMRQEAKLEKSKQSACAAVNAHHKRVKTYGVKVKNYLAIFKQMTAKDDGDEFIQDLKEQRRLAQMIGLPIGHQFNLIDEIASADAVSHELGDKAYRDGARAHLDGVEEIECPHAENSVEGQEWLRGYRWSVDVCGDGERELQAYDENTAGPDESAEGTEPASPTSAGREASEEATVH